MQAQYRALYKARARTKAFQQRHERAFERIEEFLSVSERPYVSFSGGKDSTCLLILLTQLQRTEVPVFTQGDDLDWPDKREHCEQLTRMLGFCDNHYGLSDVSAADQFAALDGVAEIRGTFSHVIERYVAERQRDGVLLGLRAAESRGRKALAKYRGGLFRTTTGEWRGLPLIDWSAEDTFALIISTDTPYMRLYDCDQHRAPHEWRMSWPANPAYWRGGSAAELKRHFPEYFARLAALNPRLRDYA